MFSYHRLHLRSTEVSNHRNATNRNHPFASFCRRLRFEPLEHRRLLATITVDTLTDGIGVPGTSLREAIAAAAANDTINFSVTGTINLTNLGELAVNKNLTINGPGSNLLTINAFDPTPATNNGDGSRVMAVSDIAASLLNVSISGLTLTGGDSPDAGGGIANAENLTLTGCVITGNSSGGSGGGIVSLYGDLTIAGSTISGNAAVENGGGVTTAYNELTVTNSTISGNTAEENGGGIYCYGALTNISDSTVSGNIANTNAGGIDNHFGTLNLTDSIVRNNSSDPLNGYGGGIWNYDGTVNVTNSRITGNEARSGGGILNTYGDLTISYSEINDNDSRDGGGIYTYFGTMSMTRSEVDHNSVAFGNGGGILVVGGMAIVEDSTVSFNYADTDGGGIANQNGNLIVRRSTVYLNSANSGSGGGVFSQTDTLHTTMIENSTVSRNSTFGRGAGVMNANGIVSIRHCTIVDNSAFTDSNGNGVVSQSNSSTLTQVHSSIISRNGGHDVTILGGFVNTFESLGYNLVDSGNAVANFFKPGDQTFTVPNLRFLTDNGGWTGTYLLLPGSPGIDQGDPSLTANPAVNDQRGAGYLRVADGDGGGGARSDIGAFERQNPGTPQAFVVDTLADEIDGNYSAGDLSLREAIGLTNANFLVADTISFSPALIGGTIVLQHGVLLVNDPLAINGLGADKLTIDASGNDLTPTVKNGDGSGVIGFFDPPVNPEAPFVVASIDGLALTGSDGPSAVFSNESLTISNCILTGNAAFAGGAITSGLGLLNVVNTTISGNSATDHGGGIAAGGVVTVTITGSTITGNSAPDGGGLHVRDSGGQGGTLTVSRSTISGNSATGAGGGIYHRLNTATISDSTVSGNSASYGAGLFQATGGTMTIVRSTISGNDSSHSNGGGIEIVNATLNVHNSTISGNLSGAGGGILSYFSTTTINNSTITANYASVAGGGLNVTGGTATLSHTIVAGNTGDLATRDDISGPVSATYSFIGDNTGAVITNNGGNQIGTAALPKNPMLGPLANNFGPTKTHALLSGSTAVDAGHPVFIAFPNVDQRGEPFVRVFNGDGIGGARVDIGAFELQPPPPGAIGDFNDDDAMDAADYVMWRKLFGTTGVPFYSGADGDGDGMVDPGDYGVWRTNFGESLPGAGGSQQVASAAGGFGSGEGPEYSFADFGSRVPEMSPLLLDFLDLLQADANVNGVPDSPFVSRAQAIEDVHDDALLAWLITGQVVQRGDELEADNSDGSNEDGDASSKDERGREALDAYWEAGAALV